MWWDATEMLPILFSNTARDSQAYTDALRFILLTGMRRDEVLKRLYWSGVDFSMKTVHIDITKNGDDLLLPMSDYIEAMLIRRFEDSGGPNMQTLVFDGVSAQKATDKIVALTKNSSDVTDEGLHRSPHDLRCSFKTFGRYAGVDKVTCGAMMNHRSPKGDVTDDYDQWFLTDNLREPMQLITDFYLLSILV